MFIKHDTITARGKTYQRMEFESLEDLELFFVTELLGRTDVQSKAIGTVLIWGKK
jgi:hypothetical protein